MEMGFNQPIRWSECNANEQTALLTRPAIAASDNIRRAVTQIIEQVQARGDNALIEFSQRFDKTAISSIRVTPDSIEQAESRLNDDIKVAMKNAIGNIRRFHEAQKPEVIRVETQSGVVCQQITRPIDSVGLYIPGGSAPLLSTVMMLGTPAQIAGCRQIILCSPHLLRMKFSMLQNCVVLAISFRWAVRKPLLQWHLVQRVSQRSIRFLAQAMLM